MSEKVITVIITFLVAAAYFSGFCHLYAYYRFFGIEIFELDFSIQFILTHAFTTFYYAFSGGWQNLRFLIPLAVILFCLYVFILEKRKHNVSPAQYYLCLIVIIFTSFAMIYGLGRSSGTAAAQGSSKNLKVSYVHYLVDKTVTIGRYRFITNTKEIAYFLEWSENGSEFWLRKFPMSRIVKIEIYED